MIEMHACPELASDEGEKMSWNWGLGFRLGFA